MEVFVSYIPDERVFLHSPETRQKRLRSPPVCNLMRHSTLQLTLY